MTNNLEESLKEFKNNFDKKIIKYFDAKKYTILDLKRLNEDIKTYILSGGKRLRPYLLYRFNQEFNQINNIDNILLAFEFLHNSTLIDDDIIDEHNLRRNQPTLPEIYNCSKYKGDFVALLSANILRNEGLEILLNSKLKNEIKKEFILSYQDIGKSIDDAQFLDLQYRGKLNISEKQYLEKVNLVTAKFIAYMFCIFAPNKFKRRYYEAGINLGIAFQLTDDLMDIDKNKQKGRDLGSDIREGSPNLLSLYTSKKLNGTDKIKFEELFGYRDLGGDELEWIFYKYKETSAIKYVVDKTISYVNKADDILEGMGIAKTNWVRKLGVYSLQRNF
jgi:geranylgeranyl diphosphate synthase, type II